MKRLLLPLFLAAFVLGPAAKSEANLIENGSFENPSLAPGTWAQYDALTGIPEWTLVGSAPFEIGWGSVYGLAGYQGQVLELDSTANATISQNVNVDKDGVYTLSFLVGGRTTNEPTIGWAASSGFGVSFGDLNYSRTGQQMIDEGMLGNMLVRSFSVNLTAGDNLLQFWGLGQSDSLGGALLDDISVLAQARQVPDGGVAATLLGLALAGVGVFRRMTK